MTGEVNDVIPFGPVMNFVVLIVVSIWADEILQALIGSANKVTNLIQKQLIDRLPFNGKNNKAKK